MELLFVAVLVLIMAAALGMGFPVAFALPGAAILTIGLAALTGTVFTGDSGAYFAQDGPVQWLTAGVIRKEVDGETKEHRFLRADTHASAESANDFAVIKGRQIIDEQGERIFRD